MVYPGRALRDDWNKRELLPPPSKVAAVSAVKYWASVSWGAGTPMTSCTCSVGLSTSVLPANGAGHVAPEGKCRPERGKALLTIDTMSSCSIFPAAANTILWPVKCSCAKCTSASRVKELSVSGVPPMGRESGWSFHRCEQMRPGKDGPGHLDSR